MHEVEVYKLINQQLIRDLEKLLDKARNGEVVALAGVVVKNANEVERMYTTIDEIDDSKISHALGVLLNDMYMYSVFLDENSMTNPGLDWGDS